MCDSLWDFALIGALASIVSIVILYAYVTRTLSLRESAISGFLGRGFKFARVTLSDGSYRDCFIKIFDYEQFNSEMASKDKLLKVFFLDGKTSLLSKENIFSIDLLRV